VADDPMALIPRDFQRRSGVSVMKTIAMEPPGNCHSIVSRRVMDASRDFIAQSRHFRRQNNMGETAYGA
jgi:hypothetical protein